MQPGRDRLEVLLGRREPVHHTEDDLAEDDDREQPEALDERMRGPDDLAQARARPRHPRDAGDPNDGEAGPDGEAAVGRQEGADQDRSDRCGHPDNVAPRDREQFRTLGSVLVPDGIPEQGQSAEERRVHERERGPGPVGRVRGEDRQQREDSHLAEDDRARPAVFAAVQLDVQRAVRPADPDQAEHDRELERARGR